MSKQQFGRALRHPIAAAQLRQIESPGIFLTSSGATVHHQEWRALKERTLSCLSSCDSVSILGSDRLYPPPDQPTLLFYCQGAAHISLACQHLCSSGHVFDTSACGAVWARVDVVPGYGQQIEVAIDAALLLLLP